MAEISAHKLLISVLNYDMNLLQRADGELLPPYNDSRTHSQAILGVYAILQTIANEHNGQITLQMSHGIINLNMEAIFHLRVSPDAPPTGQNVNILLKMSSTAREDIELILRNHDFSPEETEQILSRLFPKS